MPFPSAATEQLTIDSVDFICPAWWVTDLSPLWGRATAVGNDIPIPGGETIPMRKRLPSWRVVLPMAIGSDVDPSGTPHADALIGLEENIDELMAVAEVLTTGDGTRDLVLTRASGAQWGAPCHVLGIDLGAVRPSGAPSAALELSIPAGKLSPLSGS